MPLQKLYETLADRACRTKDANAESLAHKSV
jgi:hypothetical protein